MMNTRKWATLVATATIMGGTMVGCAGGQTRLASAGAKAEARNIAQAETLAKKAAAALAARNAGQAVVFAENAASLRPQDATYRALLGKSYMAAGRFASARQALEDAMALDPGQAGLALNLALAQTAVGDTAAARKTIADHDAQISAADRGLALALAGDTGGGVGLLEAVARAPGADAKARQNLALAYALAGRWTEARTTAMIDLAPADADQRIVKWASFARPTGSADQVASLLGVVPVADGGQPAQLALVTQQAGVVETQTAAEPLDNFIPKAPGTETAPTAPVEVAAAPAEPVVVPAPAAPQLAQVVFGPRREVVQPIPAAPVRSAAVKSPGKAAPAVTVARGSYVVQIGAFSSAGAAQTAWKRALASYAALGGRTPSSMPVAKGKATFYRLSVGGFARADADGFCGKLRASGGKCFVRADAGDRVAQWGKVQVASR